jgi:ATP-dependent helicase/nuclease subunit A
VACTRAREELHLFAAPEENAKGEVKPLFGSLLSTAWPAAKKHFAQTTLAFDTQVEILEMPPGDTMEDEFAGQIAASTEGTPEEALRPATLQRLPIKFDPGERFRTGKTLLYGEIDDAQIAPHFARPEGSFEARVLGNVVHMFLETLSRQLDKGTEGDTLLHEITRWGPRIAAVLRGEGLSHVSVKKLVMRVQSALSSVLQNAEGRWVLGKHEGASSEYALTAWGDRRNSVRLDRVFRAGPIPLAEGSDYLWIVDYKTTAHGRAGVDEFLAEEQLKYGPQMLTYARMMQSEADRAKLRVGLYYPMLPRLVWWEPEVE